MRYEQKLHFLLFNSPNLAPKSQTTTKIINKNKELFGGVDGTRTRDPRRDRPIF